MKWKNLSTSIPRGVSATRVCRTLGPVIIAGVVLLGCPPSNAPDFDFSITQAGTTLFGESISPGVFDTNLAWSGTELGPAYSIGTGLPLANPLSATFSMSNPPTLTYSLQKGGTVTLASRYEAEMTLRDPNELLATLIDDSGTQNWPLDAMTPSGAPPYALPDALVMPFPFDGTAATLVYSPMSAADFWTTGVPSQFMGPAAGPASLSSVKGVSIYKGGVCSREIPLQPLLDQITGSIPDGIMHKCYAATDSFLDLAGGDLLPEVKQVNATAVSHHIVGLPSSVEGGFAVELRAELSVENTNWPISFDTCVLDSVFSYDLYANQGIASVHETQQTDDFTHGYLCESDHGFNNQVVNALQTTLPNTFAATAQGMQTFNRDNPPDPAWACDPTAAQPCQAAIDQVRAGLISGAEILGIDSGDVSYMADAVSVLDANGNYRDWSCNNHGDFSDACLPPTQNYRCDFTVRAARFNARPDAIEAVLFDDQDYTSPAFALFVFSFNGGPDAWKQLCTKQADPLDVAGAGTNLSQDFFRRRFANSALGDATCGTASAGPGPVFCKCGQNSECGSNICDVAEGQCKGVCSSDSDCLPSQTCYGNVHLCGGDSDCSQCWPWEYCGKDSMGNDECVLSPKESAL